MDNIGTTGIIPCNCLGNYKRKVGSTFLRVKGLVANAEDFAIWKHGQKFDNLIFQKVYWKEMMEIFQGPKILDLCDPDWLKEFIDIADIASLIDAITCSSEGLTQLVRNYFPQKPVYFVPDRLNFKNFPKPRGKHMNRARRVVWFGFINNAHETLEQLLPTIEKHNLSLKIISDRPYTKEDGIKKLKKNKFIDYNEDTAYTEIKKNDIVLNPKSNKAFFKYKSNNKSIIAWKLGLPVAENNEDLERLLDPNERNSEVEVKRDIVNKEYNIEKSAEQYREIITSIRNQCFLNESCRKC